MCKCTTGIECWSAAIIEDREGPDESIESLTACESATPFVTLSSRVARKKNEEEDQSDRMLAPRASRHEGLLLAPSNTRAE
jgi:hypothetical protein